mgnify:CR=1 FL=1
MDKKGVSPLIATVLLIAFAVAVGAVVMNWVASVGEHNACVEVEMSVASVCYDPELKHIVVKVQNGDHVVPGIRLYAKGMQGVEDVQLKKIVGSQEKKEFRAIYLEEDLGSIREISVWPLMGVKGQDFEPCEELEIRKTDIGTC